MKFVQSSAGTDVAHAYVNSLSLSWVPSNLYFSGVAGGRIKSKNGYNGHGILITTPSHLLIFSSKGEEIWNQPLETIFDEVDGFELKGIDLIQFKYENKKIEFGTGLKSRKKLVLHLSEAKKESVYADEISRNLTSSKPPSFDSKKYLGNNAVLKPGMSKEEIEIKKNQIRSEEAARIKTGKLVVEDYFSKTVRIYENGYVQISGIFGGKSAPFEKLLGISSSYNHKGDDGFLTISTETKTHSLHLDKRNIDARQIKSMNRLVTAGQAVLESLRTRQSASTNQDQLKSEPHKSISAADEIAKLVALRDAGAISDEEFQALKKKLM